MDRDLNVGGFVACLHPKADGIDAQVGGLFLLGVA
jgi:hypothetical protein